MNQLSNSARDCLLISRSFVCATSKQTSDTVVLSSYYSPRRGSDLLDVTTIWQAARATSAATTFFDPIEFGDEEFVDGATGANNPSPQMWTEATDKWREGSEWHLSEILQCMVSIGTGMPSLAPFKDDILGIGGTLLQIATETQKTAEQFERDHADLQDKKCLFRFNVLQGLENIGLEEASQRKTIMAATRRYLESQDVFTRLQACAKNLAERECASNFA